MQIYTTSIVQCYNRDFDKEEQFENVVNGFISRISPSTKIIDHFNLAYKDLYTKDILSYIKERVGVDPTELIVILLYGRKARQIPELVVRYGLFKEIALTPFEKIKLEE